MLKIYPMKIYSFDIVIADHIFHHISDKKKALKVNILYKGFSINSIVVIIIESFNDERTFVFKSLHKLSCE